MPTMQTSPASFSRELWQANLPLYEKTLALPFNQELAAGTLGRERFRRYIIQDAHYLLVYGRALAAAAAKADHADGVVQFAEAARTAVVVERSLHDGFMRDYGIPAQDFAATPLSPACHHYTQFLLATAWSAPYPVVLACLLPCYRSTRKWASRSMRAPGTRILTRHGYRRIRARNFSMPCRPSAIRWTAWPMPPTPARAP